MGFPYNDRVFFKDSDADVVMSAIFYNYVGKLGCLAEAAEEEWRIRVEKLNEYNPIAGLTEWERVGCYGGNSRRRTNDKLKYILEAWDNNGKVDINTHHEAMAVVIRHFLARVRPSNLYYLKTIQDASIKLKSSKRYNQAVDDILSGFVHIHALHLPIPAINDHYYAYEEPSDLNLESWVQCLVDYIIRDFKAFGPKRAEGDWVRSFWQRTKSERTDYILEMLSFLGRTAQKAPNTRGNVEQWAARQMYSACAEIDPLLLKVANRAKDKSNTIPRTLLALIEQIKCIDDTSKSLLNSAYASRDTPGLDEPLIDEARTSIIDRATWWEKVAQQTKNRTALQQLVEELLVEVGVLAQDMKANEPKPITVSTCELCNVYYVVKEASITVARSALERLIEVESITVKLANYREHHHKTTLSFWRKRDAVRHHPDTNDTDSLYDLIQRRSNLLKQARELTIGRGEDMAIALLPQIARIEAITDALHGNWYNKEDEKSWARLMKTINQYVGESGPNKATHGGRRRIIRNRN